MSIKNGQVKHADLGRGAVSSVASGEIADGSVHNVDLAPDAQPDRDLDLIRAGPISVDDPADGVIPTQVGDPAAVSRRG